MEEETIQVDRVLNLMPEQPPYTYHKARLALAAMAPGQVLRVLVQTPAAASNVRQNIQAEGHRVLDVSHRGEHEWFVTIRRK